MSLDSQQLHEELQRAREELRHWESFIAVVAHELRNPIAPVLISIDALMLEVASGKLDRDTLLRRLQLTRRYVDGVRTHLDRLLDFSRLRNGHIDLHSESVDLSALVGSVIDEMAPMLEAAQCEVTTTFTMPLVGRWDRMRLRQVIWNLVSNAAKYAAGSPIEITTSRDETSVRLTVTDHGPGIAEHDQELVFRRFERSGAEANHTGFGVGLWLVRRIVDAMGGKIELRSELGRGATFTVTLPRTAAA